MSNRDRGPLVPRRPGYPPVVEYVSWDERPRLRRPLAVAAFEGWGDAGSASSLAAGYLLEAGEARRVAVIDPDEFFDFQVRRPLVELTGDAGRTLVWPDTEVSVVALPGAERDLVVVTGPEPHSRWKAYVGVVTEVLRSLGVGDAVTLGAFLGQVPHTLPVPLVGTSSDPQLLRRHHLFSSGYEGPTGIVGVLNLTLSAAGIRSVSVWAAVPHYLSSQEYPPAALALVEKAMEIAGLRIDTSDLEATVAEYREEVAEALAESDLTAYVAELEEQANAETPVDPGDRLVDEIERFLREG